MNKGKLIIVSAPSGAGKTTLVRHLLSVRNDLKFSISATSRPLRTGEIDGRDYYFISEIEFREKIRNKEFLEWEEVYPGHLYGTLKSEVDRITESGNHIIFDVDVVGGLNIKNIYGDEALSIFVMPSSTATTTTTTIKVLEERLRNRSTETEEKIRTRLAKASAELQFASKFDAIILNNDLGKAQSEAETIVEKFLSR